MFRNLIRSLAFLIALQPAILDAQQFPITMPANTVYGRLGIGPGPGSAIPFAALTQGVLAILGGQSCSANNFVTGFGTGGAPTCAQPAFSGLTGTSGLYPFAVNSFTGNHPIASSDCGTVVQMGTGASGQLLASLGTPFSSSGPCPIRIQNGNAYNAGVSEGVMLSGFPSAAFPTLYPGQSIDISISPANTWIVTRGAGRWRQSGVQFFAAKSTGTPSDTANDCLSLTHPCLTIMHTMALVYNQVDHQGGQPTIFLNGGDAFPECVTAQGQLTGYNVGLIASASGVGTSGGATWGNVTGSCPSNAVFTIADNAEWQLQNLLITNASGTSGIDGVHMHQTGVLDSLGGMAYGMFPGAAGIGSDNNSMINMDANYTIIAGGGTTPVFFGIGPATTLNECGSCATIFSGAPTITTMYSATGAGATITFGPSHTFTNSATIANACSVNGPSAISMASNTLPGTTACTSGSAARGGQVF